MLNPLKHSTVIKNTSQKTQNDYITTINQLVLYLLLLGAELPLVESFGLLNDLFPFPSILEAGYPVFDLQLANVLFDVILPSALGSSL